ncbi:S-adenosyl-L-methionine-dependent methyltransferase [Limtongia smithiae]|uniref:S-adenosyl-L-methionine-dependent methyltransferase n=1 Tax=Limtongia smithiae TaxID=1125753 RepID=UPI0034CF9892
MRDYLILFAQTHETFRKLELEALAELEQVSVDMSDHSEESPLLVVSLESEDAAIRLTRRAILVRSVFEVWGCGATLEELHEDMRRRTQDEWPKYKQESFRFDIISFQGSRTSSEQRQIMESFDFLDFQGPIRMRDAKHTFTVVEEYVPIPSADLSKSHHALAKMWFGRHIADGQRDIIAKYDLKKRHYIGTTSFDAELALVSSNIGLAAPGKLVYDPFAGTGSFLVGAAHFGATVIGSDIDGRQIRGKPKRNITTNFKQYNISAHLLDTFVCDFTHCPLRPSLLLDAIICDPPYGVREGLKVLGSRNKGRYADGQPTVLENGDFSHLRADYIPPKKPYHFDALLDDLVVFAAEHLVDRGRLCCWMPTANDKDEETGIPTHPELVLIGNCIQEFNKWSRRLLTYVRTPRGELPTAPVERRTYNEQFRDKYFRGFAKPTT